MLRGPLLYLSLYLKRERETYYELLTRVRVEGAWEEWVEFFLEGVREVASGAVATAERLTTLFRDHRAEIERLGRPAGSALRVHQALKERPICSLAVAKERTGLSFPAASGAMARLEELGMVRELTGQQRNRLFAYSDYLEILSEGTEL